MTPRKTLIMLAAAAGMLCLVGCETDYGPATSANRDADRPVNRACRPGDTAAGTRSGLTCDSGSSTGTPAGSDANVSGASTAGSAPAAPGP